jgi:hypothetical protein
MSAQQFVILLPPTEGKAVGGQKEKPWKPDSGSFGSSLEAHRSELMAHLKKSKGGDQKLLGVSGAHLTRAQDANTHHHECTFVTRLAAIHRCRLGSP